jgi:hypothetical protein
MRLGMKIWLLSLLADGIFTVKGSGTNGDATESLNVRRQDGRRRRQQQQQLPQEPNVVPWKRDVRIPNPYPITFEIQFVTNITTSPSLSQNYDYNRQQRQQQQPTEEYPIHGTLYYDWTKRVQRIDHDPGSYECMTYYGTSSKCILLFIEEGMYRILPPSTGDLNNRDDDDDDGVDCCLDLPNVGTPPPDWASKVPSTWKEVVWDDYDQVLASEWWFDQFPLDYRGKTNSNSDSTVASLPFHTLRQVAFDRYGDDGLKHAVGGRPVVFTFPGKADGRQDMHYLYRTMKEQVPDSSLFDLPDGCRHKRCSQQETS